jgi:FtsH-binding integral membrane protein
MRRDDAEAIAVGVWCVLVGCGLAFAVAGFVTGSRVCWALSALSVVICVGLALYDYDKRT